MFTRFLYLQVPQRSDEDNLVFALHDAPGLGSSSGQDRAAGVQTATPRALAKYGIVGDYGAIGNLDTSDSATHWAGGYKVCFSPILAHSALTRQYAGGLELPNTSNSPHSHRCAV